MRYQKTVEIGTCSRRKASTIARPALICSSTSTWTNTAKLHVAYLRSPRETPSRCAPHLHHEDHTEHHLASSLSRLPSNHQAWGRCDGPPGRISQCRLPSRGAPAHAYTGFLRLFGGNRIAESSAQCKL